MRVQKYFKELQKFSPDHIPIDYDEEDPTEFKGINKETPLEESLYGQKTELYQENPINLYDTEAGMRDLFSEEKK